MTNIRKCLSCKVKPRKSKHSNSKYCEGCRKSLQSKPIGKLNKKQEAFVRKNADKIVYEKLAIKIGTPRANLMRWASQNRVKFTSLKYSEDVINKVCKYYEKHGKAKTQKKFPDVNVRSIVERNKIYKPRLIRWTEKQKTEAARMSGLVSNKKQAQIFNRPRANEGSIHSLWCKNFGVTGYKSLHGLPNNIAKHIVTKKCPVFKSGYLKIHFWVDIKKHLRKDAPESIREAITALASFQKWIFKNKHPLKYLENI